MDILLIISACFISLVLLYILMHYKITSIVHRHFKEHYGNEVRSDMQEFYREMEGYIAIFDSKIKAFKQLISMQEKNLQEWRQLIQQVKTSPKAKKTLEQVQENINKKIAFASEEQERFFHDLFSKMQQEKKTIQDARRSTQNQKNTQSAQKSVKQALPKTGNSEIDSNIAASILKEQLQQKDELFLKQVKEVKTNEKQDKEGLANKAMKEILISFPTLDDNSSTIAQYTKAFLARFGRSFATLINFPLSNPTVNQAVDQQEENSSINQPYAEKGNYSTKNTLKPLNKVKSTTPPDNNQKVSAFLEKNIHEQNMIHPTTNIDKQFANMLHAKTSNKQAPNTNKVELSTDTLMLFIEDLKNYSKRPKALQALLHYGYSLHEIAKMSGIPYSDIMTTYQIYHLEKKGNL